MLQLVNEYYESCGDTARLKYSFLEEYAVSRGFDVKAYDFRRNADVRLRIGELRDMEAVSTRAGAIAYKSLDVDALISKSRNKEALRNSLLELDETWRRIYDRAAILSQQNEALSSDIRQKTLDCEKLTCEAAELSAQMAALKKEHRNALLENRYLKKMLKTYLYPAIANEILKSENVLEQADTEVTQTAMDVLTGPDVPTPFSKSVEADRQMLSREESLLRRMREQLHEEDNDV